MGKMDDSKEYNPDGHRHHPALPWKECHQIGNTKRLHKKLLKKTP